MYGSNNQVFTNIWLDIESTLMIDEGCFFAIFKADQTPSL